MGMTQIGPTKGEFDADAKKLQNLTAVNSQTWGNQLGTLVTDLSVGGGDVALRKDNPKSGMLSMVLDGTLYVNEGNYPVMYSREIDNVSIPQLVTELRYGQGATGSAYITTAWTQSNVTIPANNWYNYLWMPHRMGGRFETTDAEYSKYGSLLLCMMTGGTSIFRIRLYNGSIDVTQKLI